MKKIKDSIKYIKLSDLIAPFVFIFMIIPSLIFRIINKLKKRSLWLVCEDGTTARDNGYHFYKYVRTNHPNDYCFYVIDKNKPEYAKVEDFANIIQFKSLKHWLYYLSADYNISNHKNGNPNQPFFYLLHVSLGLYKNRVFLQHGITKDDAEWLYYKNTKFRYFICGAKQEYEFIKERFGYPEDYVIYTGFPRFDNLYNNNVNEKQILVMPTWRNWLGRETNNLGEKLDFTKTSFYENWSNFLNNENLVKYIEKNKITLLFYPHINMQKYLNEFKIKSKNIKLLDTKTDIQTVLKESAILVTDYSSVYMDFSYMLKPIIFFQFDYDEYRKRQYQLGYFDYKEEKFGKSLSTSNEVVLEIKKLYEEGISKLCKQNMESFFEIKDQNNSGRIYSILKRNGE